jgi:hypothetical protein
MKTATLLISLALITPFYTTHANEEMNDQSMDIRAYCEEQAQLAGIEDATESTQYIQECIDSFGIPSDEMQ